jgi:hypothetical protein
LAFLLYARLADKAGRAWIMMAKLKVTLGLLLLFVQPAIPGDGGGAKSLPDGRIAELRKQIASLRAKTDVKGLRQLGVEIKAEWLANKSPTHYQAILELCLAMSSTRTTEPGINESIRDLVVAAIDSPGEKPAQIVADLLLFLQGDIEYSSGQLHGEGWVKERRTRAERWLKVCKSIREQNAALPKPTGTVYLNLMAPEGLRSGVAPSAVKDPILRKKYEEAIAENSKRADAHRNKRYLEDSEQSAAQRAERYLTETFSKPPFRAEELTKLLEIYQFPKASHLTIIDEVRRREAAKIERDAKLAKMASAIGRAPTPRKLQYSLDGSTFHDASFPLYVMQGTTVTFKPPATGDSWVWKGSSGASGEGVKTKVVFSELSKDITDFKTVIASHGGDTITAHVIVYDLFPIYTPEHNFPGRDLDAYGVCEFINLSYKTAPAGISESDLGGLQWVIKSGDGDLYGRSGGIGTYQCSDVGGRFILAIQVVARPSIGEQIRKK